MQQQNQGQQLQDDGQRLAHGISLESTGDYLAGWLRGREQRYGGMHTNVKRRTVSPLDPRAPQQVAKGGMTGGDRMTHHGYAPAYARAITEHCMAAVAPEVLRALETKFAGGVNLKLRPARPSPHDTQPNPKSVFDGHRMQSDGDPRVHNYAPTYAANLPDSESRITLVELGILRGVGLAIWCDLFPNARVIGLDVDTSHFRDNEADLLRRGAFKKNKPEVIEFDELAPDAGARLKAALAGSAIDVFIDDALHYDAAILKIMAAVMPLMAKGGIYFVEDNVKVHKAIRKAYPRLAVESMSEMTVIRC